MGWACGTNGGEEKCIQGFCEEPEGKRPLGRDKYRWKEIIKMNLKEIQRKGMHWIHLAQDRDKLVGVKGYYEHGSKQSGCIKSGEFLD